MLLEKFEERHKKELDYTRSKKTYSAHEAGQVIGLSHPNFLKIYDDFFEYGMIGLDKYGLPSLPLPLIIVSEKGKRAFRFSWWDIKLLEMWYELRKLKRGRRCSDKIENVKGVKWCDETERYIVIYEKDIDKEEKNMV